MNRDRMEGNWEQFAGIVNERWDNLTESHLASRVQDGYGMTNVDDDEGETQLTGWQERLGEIKRAAAREALS